MTLNYTFLHMESNPELVAHFEERLQKILKFELKPMDVDVVFSHERHECIVDVHIVEGRRKFKAQGCSDDFARSIEMVVNKTLRQMAKDRRRMREHKNPQASHEGKLARLSAELGVSKPKRSA